MVWYISFQASNKFQPKGQCLKAKYLVRGMERVKTSFYAFFKLVTRFVGEIKVHYVDISSYSSSDHEVKPINYLFRLHECSRPVVPSIVLTIFSFSIGR
jgi:hypothetical protein